MTEQLFQRRFGDEPTARKPGHFHNFQRAFVKKPFEAFRGEIGKPASVVHDLGVKIHVLAPRAKMDRRYDFDIYLDIHALIPPLG